MRPDVKPRQRPSLSAQKSVSTHGSGFEDTAEPFFEFKMVAFKPNQLSEADKRAGVGPTSTIYKEGPTLIEIDVLKMTFEEFKNQIAGLAEEYQPGFGDLFKEADLKGTINYYGFVNDSLTFPKSNPRQIAKLDDFERFKKAVSRHIGKLMGLHAMMIDENAKPKKIQGAENATQLDAVTEILRTRLYNLYRDKPKGNREKMTCYNVDNPRLMIKLDDDMLTVWAQSIANNELDVTISNPPIGKPGFKWTLRPAKTSAIPQTAANTSATAPVPTPPIVPTRYSHPPLEDYLSFCRIQPGDQVTRRVIATLGIAEFYEFESIHNTVYDLEKSGMLRGPAVRLRSRASAYRDHLKTRTKSPGHYSYPPLEEYLSFCRIQPDDQVTRRVIETLGIAEFYEFESIHNTVYDLEKSGMLRGPAVRLRSRASAYRDYLKTRV